MIGNKQVLAIIPARGKSKSVTRKNIKDLGGKPLIYYTIREAKLSKYIDKLVVSSDDQDIIDVSISFGAEAPFRRPEELAADDTRDLPVFQHAVQWMEAETGFHPDIVLNLRPTSPFRKVEDIDGAIELLYETQADSVKTLSLASEHPHRMWKLGENHTLIALEDTDGRVVEGSDARRQDLPEVYWQNEYVDVCLRENIMNKNSMFGHDRRGYVIEERMTIDLNTNTDFEIAEIIIEKKLLQI